MLKNEVAVLKRQMANSSANLFRHPDRSKEMCLYEGDTDLGKKPEMDNASSAFRFRLTPPEGPLIHTWPRTWKK